jgi:hypothetical protein
VSILVAGDARELSRVFARIGQHDYFVIPRAALGYEVLRSRAAQMIYFVLTAHELDRRNADLAESVWRPVVIDRRSEA